MLSSFRLLFLSMHFFLWLALKDAIVTKEHMCRWGYSGDSLCLFCRSRQENRDYLFFECSLSKRV
jgi:hypothetical protein